MNPLRALLVLALCVAPLMAEAQTTRSSTNRAARCPANVDLNELEAVRLGEDGRCVLSFTTERPGIFQSELFSYPSSTGAITVSFRQRGAEEALAPGVYDAGRYEAVLQAVNPGEAVVQLRLALARPRDPFEPNDTLEDAARVDLPFESVVHLTGGEQDWFRVDPALGGIVGVHLHIASDYQGPRIGFYEADGTEILVSNNSNWGVRGMRYVRSRGRPIFIAVWDTNNWGDENDNAYKRIEIVQYRPEGAPSSTRSLVALGLESEGPEFEQLDFIGAAIGVETVSAAEAEEIAEEIRAAVQRRGTNWGLIAIVILLLAAAGGGGFYFFRMRR